MVKVKAQIVENSVDLLPLSSLSLSLFKESEDEPIGSRMLLTSACRPLLTSAELISRHFPPYEESLTPASTALEPFR